MNFFIEFHTKQDKNINYKMTQTNDYQKMNKSDLVTLCKENSLKKYSKLSKEELFHLLVGANVKFVNGPDSEPSSSKKVKAATASPKKIREPTMKEKLNKYMALDEYKEELAKFNEDVTDEEIIKLISPNIAKFIEGDDVTDDDRRKYVIKYETAKAVVEYTTSADKKQIKIDKISSTEELYKVLAEFIYKSDMVIYSGIVSKFKKHVVSLYRAKKPAAAPKSKGKAKSKKEDDSEPESDDSDDESEKGDESGEESNAE